MSAVALSGAWRPEEVRGELERLEDLLRENLSGAPGTLGEVARSALAAGGKRMRPRLVFAAAGLCGGGASAAEICRPFAMAVEYLHTATLLHDDLVDGATLRRGEIPAYRRFGPKEAVLAGDLLLARCLALVTGESTVPGAAEALAKATERMAIGEALEIELARRVDVDEDTYYLFAAAKTAALFAAAAELGVLAAGGTREQRVRLARFGELLGTAFQVVDDVLDLGASEESGKKQGIDLEAGVPTLPALKALAKLSGADRSLLEGVLRGKSTPADRVRALELVRLHGAADAAAAARSLVERARAELAPFPPGPFRLLLEETAGKLIEKLP